MYLQALTLQHVININISIFILFYFISVSGRVQWVDVYIFDPRCAGSDNVETANVEGRYTHELSNDWVYFCEWPRGFGYASRARVLGWD